MKYSLLVAAMVLAGCTLPLEAITVSKPSNGATVVSPFIVTANAQTCASVPTVSMAYSIDSGTDVFEPASFTASVPASTGSHVLHIKCWGKGKFEQVLLKINVAAPAPVSDIAVQAPSSGATLTSPFTLTASANTCGSKPAVSMGYSIDSGPSIIEPTSFTASVISAPGAHILHVKCWGRGVNDQVLVNINVVQSPAPPPAFSLPSGSYSGTQTVAIIPTTRGASIYFTTDGSVPSASSALYTGPIAVTKSMILQAIAVAPGYQNSGIARAGYTISLPAAVPIFSLPSGSYNSAQTVAIISSTPAASIYFTTDGSAPSTGSFLYTGPITTSKSVTLQAIAVAPGYQNSGIASASYTISLPAAAPVFSLPSGSYNSTQTVAMSSSTPGATIYYTMDGSAPSPASALYTGPITASKSITLQAIAVAPGYQNSGTASASYKISLPAAVPTFSLPSGSYNSTQSVTMASPTPGASIYYTMDGSAPSTASALYTGPITVSKSFTLQAISVAPGYQSSGSAIANYTISLPSAVPTFSLPAGSYNSAQSLAIASATPGAAIYYTMDGSAPSTASAPYLGPITISKTATIQAIAIAPGYQKSEIAIASYAISISAATPNFSLPSGTYNSTQTLTMSSSTAGAAIYFTTDGSAPSTSSNIYSGPITLSKTATIQAIAIAPGCQKSDIASASYTISAPKGPQIPSYARVDQQLNLLPKWRIKQDPAMSGTSTGSMSLVSDPTLTGQSTKYSTTYTNGGGTLYSVTYGNDTDSTNFVYDVYVWIASGSVIANLELDNNQVMRNGDTVIYAFQCSGYTNTWEFTENSGTKENPKAHWLKSTQPCNPAKWTRDTWHHIQIQTSRDDSGNVTYHSVWFDGVEAPINQTVNSDFPLGWALGALVVNFQVDGLGKSSSSTVYADNLMMSRW